MDDSAGLREPDLDATGPDDTAPALPAWRPARGRTGRVGARRDALAAETLRLYASDGTALLRVLRRCGPPDAPGDGRDGRRVPANAGAKPRRTQPPPRRD